MSYTEPHVWFDYSAVDGESQDHEHGPDRDDAMEPGSQMALKGVIGLMQWMSPASVTEHRRIAFFKAEFVRVLTSSESPTLCEMSARCGIDRKTARRIITDFEARTGWKLNRKLWLVVGLKAQ